MQNELPPLKPLSRYGLWRDLLPLYSPLQSAWFIGVIAIAIFIAYVFDKDKILIVIPGAVIGALSVQYLSRPAIMEVSRAEGAIIETALETEGYYTKNDDGLWRVKNAKWWSNWPHYTIDIIWDGQKAVVRAPMSTISRLQRFVARRRN